MTPAQDTGSIAEKRLTWAPSSGGYVAQPTRAQTVGFIKGPLPLTWVRQAAALPGKTLHVALTLWYLVGLQKTKTVRLTAKPLTAMGVSRDAKYDALTRLMQAGLVTIEQQPGRVPVVTLVDVI
jgi:hypothetical protein